VQKSHNAAHRRCASRSLGSLSFEALRGLQPKNAAAIVAAVFG